MTLQPAMGNPSSSEVKRLIDAMRGGADFDSAALFAGLNPADFTPELWEEVTKARAEAIIRAVAQIQKAAHQGDWKAAAWWLERNVPDYQGKGRAVLITCDYVCPEGHQVTLTQLPENVLECGICQQVMHRHS